MHESGYPNEEIVDADQWYQWLEAAKRYEYNWQTRKAIAAFKPAKKKRPIQVSGMPSLDLSPRNPEHPTDGVVS